MTKTNVLILQLFLVFLIVSLLDARSLKLLDGWTGIITSSGKILINFFHYRNVSTSLKFKNSKICMIDRAEIFGNSTWEHLYRPGKCKSDSRNYERS